jgi:hypothetical protein
MMQYKTETIGLACPVCPHNSIHTFLMRPMREQAELLVAVKIDGSYDVFPFPSLASSRHPPTHRNL